MPNLVCKNCGRAIQEDKSKSTKNWKALKSQCECGSKELTWEFPKDFKEL